MMERMIERALVELRSRGDEISEEVADDLEVVGEALLLEMGGDVQAALMELAKRYDINDMLRDDAAIDGLYDEPALERAAEILMEENTNADTSNSAYRHVRAWVRANRPVPER